MSLNLRHTALYLAFLAIVLAATVVAVVGVGYLFWMVHFNRLAEIGKPKTDEFPIIANVSPQSFQRLGQILTARKSSFINFDRKKVPGTVRIAAFGDSFTYGDEVEDGSDYPAQLQKMLREYGVANVEVLNFGSSWYSFGQAYTMWNEVGREFDPDYLLFGPQTLHPDRETRFNHSQGSSPYYIHSRYVLDGSGVRLVDVPGDTYSEKFGNYYSFIPDSRVLKYDRNDPAFVAGALPKGQQFGNAFYYDGRSEFDEAVEIQRRLFQLMRSSGESVLAAGYSGDGPVRRATRDLIGGNFCITEFDRETDFPYTAPWGHNSPTGNALLARQYLSALLKRQIDAKILHTEDLDNNTSVPVIEGQLSSTDQIHIKLGGADAGIFTPVFPLNSAQKRPSFLREDGIASLIGFKAPENSILDGIFLASHAEIQAAGPVRLVVQSAKGGQSADLGKMRPIAQGVNLAYRDLPGLEVRSTAYGDRRVVLNEADLSRVVGDISSNARLTVTVGDKAVLEGSGEGEAGIFVLRPVDAELLVIRSTASGDLSAGHDEEEGNVEFELERGTDRLLIPIAQWWVEHRRLDPPSECPDYSASLIVIDQSKLVAAKGAEKIVITASGDEFNGPPQIRVYSNGKLAGEAYVSAAHNANQWQSFTFANNSTEQTRLLQIELANEKTGDETKRNLFIKGVSVGSQELRLEEGKTPGFASIGIAGQPRPIYSGSLVFLIHPKD